MCGVVSVSQAARTLTGTDIELDTDTQTNTDTNTHDTTSVSAAAVAANSAGKSLCASSFAAARCVSSAKVASRRARA